MTDKELFGISEQLESNHVADPGNMAGDLISRQAAIDALKMDISIIPFAKAREYVRAAIEMIYNRLEELPSAEPEEDCGTCKHGIFGSTQCDNCRVRYPSHYERRTDDGE